MDLPSQRHDIIRALQARDGRIWRAPLPIGGTLVLLRGRTRVVPGDPQRSAVLRPRVMCCAWMLDGHLI